MVYGRVLARILAAAGYRIVIAADLGQVDPADAGRLAQLVDEPMVEVCDIRAGGGRRASGDDTFDGLKSLVQESGASVTFLTEADNSIPSLADAARRGERLPGRAVGLFLRSTNYQYRAAPRLRSRVKSRLWGRRRDGTSEQAFHERLLPQKHPLDAALVLDERYAGLHRAAHLWMPDIFRDEGPAEGGEEAGKWRPRLQEFLAAQPRRPVLVYVGTNQHRRGYDTLLHLALAEDACVLHCGRFVLDGELSDEDVRASRAALSGRGALFETGDPYLEPATPRMFLEAARCVVLPYRQHHGSSGVMLQALASGRPVLVPDRGLMAHRARSFGVGATYRDGDAADLRRAFRSLDATGPEPYAPVIEPYMDCFSDEQLTAAVLAAVTGEGDGARLPVARRRAPVSGEAAS
jgi:hypothetical protein